MTYFVCLYRSHPGASIKAFDKVWDDGEKARDAMAEKARLEGWHDYIVNSTGYHG